MSEQRQPGRVGERWYVEQCLQCKTVQPANSVRVWPVSSVGVTECETETETETED